MLRTRLAAGVVTRPTPATALVGSARAVTSGAVKG